jgi:hypothetical protein
VERSGGPHPDGRSRIILPSDVNGSRRA